MFLITTNCGMQDECLLPTVFSYYCHIICIYDKYYLYLQTEIFSIMNNWNNRTKRLLKSELVKRGISNSDLVILLKGIDLHETKASIDSKISRGSFSACFFLQCLSVIGCSKIEIEEFENTQLVAAEPNVEYKKSSHEG